MIVEQFAGPGGWSTGAKRITSEAAVGYEWSRDAVHTARAAGYERVRVDVTALPDAEVRGWRCRGFITSPPCPAWSSGGLQGARADADRIFAHLAAVAAAGTWLDYRDRDDAVVDLWGAGTVSEDKWADPRSALVLEAVRWQLLLQPRWLAAEQVPQAAGFFDAWGTLLAAQGYSVAAGVLDAVQFGLPQTRRRALLVASLERAAALPEPTHAAYVKGQPPDTSGGLLPWVSQGQAAGWPAGRVGFPRRDDRGGDGYRERDLRPTTDPAFTLTEKVRSWRRWTAGADDTGLPLTPSEAGVLQGFAAGYPWNGQPSSRFHQAADAVPPPMAEAVLRQIL